jgi:hypothetical protein
VTRAVGILGAVVVGVVLSPFWVPLLVINFAQHPRRTVAILRDKRSWVPFGGKGDKA